MQPFGSTHFNNDLNNMEIGDYNYLENWYSQKTYPLLEHHKQKGDNDGYVKSFSNWVYLFFNTDSKLFKIGKTIDPYSRSRAISTSSGTNVKIVLAIELSPEIDDSADYLEKMLHLFFHKFRVSGEWFSFGIREVVSIKNLFWETIHGESIIDNFKETLKRPE